MEILSQTSSPHPTIATHQVSRYLTWMTVFYNSLYESVAPMVMVTFALLMMVVFFSSLMFMAEKGDATWDPIAGGYIDVSTGRTTEVGLTRQGGGGRGGGGGRESGVGVEREW